MPHVAYRLYDVELPYRVPCFGVGIAINKFKQIGVWHKLPYELKEKARDAKGSWSGLKITQKDLDSIADDAWETIAVELDIGWRYATAAVEHEPAAAYG
jgi:hypothetical protein